MQIQNAKPSGTRFVPRRPRLMDVWIGVLDRAVWALTFGHAQVVRRLRGPIRWDGCIK